MTTPKLLSIPKAAKVIGRDKDTVRSWTKRAIDPLPTFQPGENARRMVLMDEVDEWLRRQANL